MPFCAGVEAWALECPDTVRDVEQPRPFYFPGMHLNFEWAVRAWNFGAAPCKREKRPCRNFDEKWFLDMRTRAAAVVQQSHRLSPEMATKVEAAMEQFRAGGPETKTFGVHMRGSDKAHSRRMVAADEFAARIESFLRAFPRGRVFTATDSRQLQAAIEQQFGARVHFRRIETRVGGQQRGRGVGRCPTFSRSQTSSPSRPTCSWTLSASRRWTSSSTPRAQSPRPSSTGRRRSTARRPTSSTCTTRPYRYPGRATSSSGDLATGASRSRATTRQTRDKHASYKMGVAAAAIIRARGPGACVPPRRLGAGAPRPAAATSAAQLAFGRGLGARPL